MSRVVRAVVGIGLTIAGVVTGNFQLAFIGVSLIGGALFGPKAPRRAASAAQIQLGEQPRQAIFGRAALGGSLVDAFNYGGKYQTDWEVLVIALADHRCDALEGFFVDDTYVAFAGDGTVAGFNNQLQVFWRNGTWDQAVPAILTTNGPGWTANDRGRGVAYVVVAYKADASDAKNPVYPGGRPRFRWVVRGLRCYQARKDTSVGGSGAHRWDNPATWEWSENPIDIRHNWVRGIYAGDRNNQPEMLLIGRGLSAVEAPPANVFARANLCDEVVAGQPRYRIGGVVASTESFLEVETDFAAAVAGVISQPEGAVEVDPGQAKAVVATFTDDDLLVSSVATWNEGILGQQDGDWINTVAARFVDPAQRWNVRGAPVRRDTADVIADGGPREVQPQLDLVTNDPQAQRIAEVIRRLGRLWGRAQVTLPPRFAFIEEGDWVAWQSNRRFGGATRTFRVEAWGSDKAWHHQLVLRQISASVYSDTAPLDDGVIAADQPPPPAIAAPDAGAWTLAAAGGSALVVSGATDDPAATSVLFEFVQSSSTPDETTIWSDAGVASPEVTRREIVTNKGGQYFAAVSYLVDGVKSDRLILGPANSNAIGTTNIGNSVTKAFETAGFSPMSNELPVQLPPGETAAQLIADNLSLRLARAAPDGVTNVEAKWQIKSAPDTWVDVGSTATSSPHPMVEEVFDPAGFSQTQGMISINATATGLEAGSLQTFRLVARVSGGNVRRVTPSGVVTAGA
jgi:Putative phage tail protein